MNVETLLIDWLRDELGLCVCATRPVNAEGSLLTVERVGGPRESVATDNATIAIQSWASSMEKAAELAGQVDKKMAHFTDVPEVCKVERDSIYRFPGENKEPRYQGTYHVTVRSCI